ncbi:UNVERIFIED_CONTAM: Endoplasmic reticulum metallopeptidase 1 [Siphonaria sp. JEL0065]|nr:Endoplasmic reticulum metallopeptidase 1 [Siphonaria sp. JEL0065]
MGEQTTTPPPPRPVQQRRVQRKPKQTGSILALIFVFVIVTGTILLRSLQGALPNPYEDPWKNKPKMVNGMPQPFDFETPNTDPNVKVVDPLEYIVEKGMELVFGKAPHMPEFKGVEAVTHLETLLAFGPRPFSSIANAQVADFIVDSIEAWRDANKNGERRLVLERDQKTIALGPFEYPAQAHNKTYSLALDNIIVKLKGQCELAGGKDCPSLLVSAHYDAVVSSPGVTDDGIAVAVILETIRTLVSDDERPLPHSIIFLLNNCEECGLLGARHFSKHKFYKSIRASINLEGGGSAGPAILFRASDKTMLNTYAKKALQPYSNVIGNDVMNLGLVKSTTDYSVYTENGESGVDIAFTRHRYNYHTKNDGWEAQYISSLQHMGDSTIKTLVTLLRNQKFMRNEIVSDENSSAPAVYWYEVYGQMAVLPFKYYTFLAVFLFSWVVSLIFVGVSRMRNFIAAHAKQVKNVSIFSVALQFKSSLILSFVAPIAVLYVIEEIRPLAIYGEPIPTRVVILFSSLVGALFPFYIVRSAFTTTDVNAYPANEHQEMLNWHVSQLGVLIAWVPVSALVIFSGHKEIGMLYVHGIWILFGCLAITVDWYTARPWFGVEEKQGDGKNAKKADDMASAAKPVSDTLKNRKGGDSAAATPEPSTTADGKKPKPIPKRSNLPNWFPIFGISLLFPLVSVIHSLHNLLLAIEPTVQDGTPAIAVVGLISIFVSILTVSVLPYILTAPNNIYMTTRVSFLIVGVAALVLLNQINEPLTIPSDVAPFTPKHPLKLAPKIEMDLTDIKNPTTTYTLTFNSLALPYVYPRIFKPKTSKCETVDKLFTRCTLDPISNKIHGPRIPELAKALDVVEYQEINRNTYTVSVRSEYSRICTLTAREDPINHGSWGGRYPYQIWPGTNSQRPIKFDPRVGEAVAMRSKFNDVTQFTVRLNRTRVEELEWKNRVLEVKVGCFIDDLAYLPGWDSLDKRILPKWAVLIGPGNGAFVVSKKFEIKF